MAVLNFEHLCLGALYMAKKLHKYIWSTVERKNVKTILMLPFAQETSFFSTFLQTSTAEAKIVPYRVELYVTSQREHSHVGITVDGTVRLLCSLGLFKLHSEGVKNFKILF